MFSPINTASQSLNKLNKLFSRYEKNKQFTLNYLILSKPADNNLPPKSNCLNEEECNLSSLNHINVTELAIEQVNVEVYKSQKKLLPGYQLHSLVLYGEKNENNVVLII